MVSADGMPGACRGGLRWEHTLLAALSPAAPPGAFPAAHPPSSSIPQHAAQPSPSPTSTAQTNFLEFRKGNRGSGLSEI